MTDPRALLDAYADEYGVTRGRLEVHAPRAFAALRAVLDLCDNDGVCDYRGTELLSVHQVEDAIAAALEEQFDGR